MKAHFAQPGTREAVAAKTKAFWDGCTGEARARRCAHLTNPEAQAKSHAAQRTPEFRARRSAWARAAWERLTDEEKIAQAELRREQWRKLSDDERAELIAKRGGRTDSSGIAFTDEEIAEAIAAKRKAVGQFLKEARQRKRIERGLPLVAPRKSRAKFSPEERLAVQRATMAKFWENHPEIRERAAAKRAALEKKRQERVAERAKRIAEREEKRKALAAEKAKKSAEREKARLAKVAARAKRLAEREMLRQKKAAARAKRLAEREKARQAKVAKRLAEREKLRQEKAAARAKRIAEREKTRQAKVVKRLAEREMKRQEKAAALAKRIVEREESRKEKAAEREKHRTAHPKPPAAPQSRRPRKRRKWKRKFLTKKEWREFNDKIHCKPVIATPKKGGKTLRFGSARNAARTLLARGVTKNALGAQQKISLVCNGYRQSAFGYYWHFESCS